MKITTTNGELERVLNTMFHIFVSTHTAVVMPAHLEHPIVLRLSARRVLMMHPARFATEEGELANKIVTESVITALSTDRSNRVAKFGHFIMPFPTHP